MKTDEEYWYMKGVEDYQQFFLDMIPKEQEEEFRRSLIAISNQLRRNVKLIKELNKK